MVSQVQSEPGILVTSVVADSPAEAAGILRGDIVLEVEGTKTDSIADLQNVLAGHEAGDVVEVLISRGGEEMTLDVTLESRLYRPAFGIQGGPGYGGPRFTDDQGPGYGRMPRSQMPGQDMFRFRFSGDDFPGGVLPIGDVVHSVQDGSPAADAGLQPGDIIVTVDGIELTDQNVGEVIQSLEPGKTIEIDLLRYVDGFSEVTVEATLSANDDGSAFLGITYMPFRVHAQTRVPAASGTTDL